jgi:hypothetical protein
MKLSLIFLRESKCPNVWHDALRLGQLSGAAVVLSDRDGQQLLKRCGEAPPDPEATPTPVPGVQPIPFEQWPLAIKELSKLATPEDQGIGDIIERMVRRIGGSAFKSLYNLATGHDCGCCGRQQALNRKYPSNSFRPS